jgi:outer membrane protein assembly complex protein YaeT
MRKIIRSVWAKVLGVAAVLALLAVGARLVLAQPRGGDEVVAEVRITGNHVIDTGEIMRYVRVRAGMTYNRSQVLEDLDRLISSKKFKDVKSSVSPMPNGIQVTFIIFEFPNLVQEVIFRHAKHISQKDLDEMTHDIKKGQPMNPASNKAAAREIQSFLKNAKGRYWANVMLEEGAEPTDRRVIFNISEGPVLRVRSTQFVGGESLAGPARLRTQIATSRAVLGLGGTYNEAQTDNDVKKLEDYFHSNGYTYAKVFRELIFSQDYSLVDVIFHIKEGIRVKINQVNITQPNPAFSDSELRALLRLTPGDYWNEGKAKQDQKYIEAYIGYRGLKPRVEMDTIEADKGLMNIEYKIEQPPEPNKVGMIYIAGNDVTQDRVILRLLNLYPGQTLRYPELELGKAALIRSNLFEMKDEASRPSVEVIPTNMDDNGVYKDILVRVKETQTGSFMIGAGINSNTGLMGNIVLNERNFDLFKVPNSLADVWDGRAFRGAGEEFRLEASPGLYVQRYSATFREPYLFDQPYSLTTSIYYFERFYTEDVEERLGGRVTLAHTLNNTWPDFFTNLFDGPVLSFLKEQRYSLSVNAGVRLEDVVVSGLTSNAPVDYTSAYGHNLVVGPKFGVVYDTRDSFLRPAAGGIIDASVETDFGNYIYQLANITASRYFTLWERPDGSGKQVVALKSQVSWASNDTPVFDRYYAGGYGTIRGFQFRGVGPNVSNYEVGGDFMWLNSIEYQVPVLANDQLYFVAFVDSGTVESSVEIHNYRVSCGVGMRLAIPMLGPMPLALDVGVPLVRGPNDHIEYIAFSVGFFH